MNRRSVHFAIIATDFVSSALNRPGFASSIQVKTALVGRR